MPSSRVPHPSGDDVVKARFCLMRNQSAIEAFAHLEKRQLAEVAKAMQRVDCAKNEQILTQGSPGDKFYIVESGRFEAFKDGKPVEAPYTEGCYFGELALLRNELRAATVRCTSPEGGQLWSIDRKLYRACVMKLKLRAVVAKIPFLRHLDDATLELMSDAMFEVPCKRGDQVIKQGEFGDNFFLVDSGRFKASRYNYHNSLGSKRDVKTLKTYEAGHGFGERALLQNAPR